MYSTGWPGSCANRRSALPADAGQGDGEFALIRRYFSDLGVGPGIRCAVGDDAAQLDVPAGETLLVSTDAQFEAVHFPRHAPAEAVAYRAVAAAASDLAAMGASPLAMTLALALPAIDHRWLEGCRAGLAAACGEFSLPLVGGDTTRGTLSLTVTVLGSCPADAVLRRDGARPGDRLCVSGTLGDAAAALALLEGELTADAAARAHLEARFWRPRPALALGLSLRGVATAAIDVSDGLLADAGHIARASGVRVDIDRAALPLSEALLRSAGRERAQHWALAGGDDYELCFSVGSTRSLPLGCRVIGYVAEGSGVFVDGQPAASEGYQHFR